MDLSSDASSSLMSQFHLGVSADGRECLMVFVDDEQNAMKCVAQFAEFRAFVANLCEIANEMARRQMRGEEPAAVPRQMVDVASGAFCHDSDEGRITGALMGANGDLMQVCMSPEVASQLCRALLMAAPASLAS